jgi:hypothetical protein
MKGSWRKIPMTPARRALLDLIEAGNVERRVTYRGGVRYRTTVDSLDSADRVLPAGADVTDRIRVLKYQEWVTEVGGKLFVTDAGRVAGAALNA